VEALPGQIHGASKQHDHCQRRKRLERSEPRSTLQRCRETQRQKREGKQRQSLEEREPDPPEPEMPRLDEDVPADDQRAHYQRQQTSAANLADADPPRHRPEPSNDSSMARY